MQSAVFTLTRSGILGFSCQELEVQLSQLAGREAEAKARVLEATARVWGFFRFLS